MTSLIPQHRQCARILGIVAAFLAAPAVFANPFSDFDDGTMQGWLPIPSAISGVPFGGTVEHLTTGGNPGGYVRATDTVDSGGGALWLGGPAEFQGDLSGYTDIQWDQFLFNVPTVVHNTSPVLIGADETWYRSVTQPLGPLEQWDTRIVSFDESNWTLGGGTMSYADVLADARLAIAMDVVVSLVPNLESGLDNILLVPEPSSAMLLAACGLAVLRRRRAA